MGVAIRESTLSEGWLAALEHLVACDGKDVGVSITISNPFDEHLSVREVLDTFLKAHLDEKVQMSVTVANTLFPQALYSGHGDAARSRLYEYYQTNWQVIQRHKNNERGTYFLRLIKYPTEKGTFNQLEDVVVRLRRQLSLNNPKHTGYELNVYVPGRDRRLMGFPCLSHISLALNQRRLYLTALYRNQHFLRKAYGNYMGLCRLLAFLCREVGCEPGCLVCIASHADAEISDVRGGKRAIVTLLEEAKLAQAQSCPQPVLRIEESSR
jgi:hypothetical protein